MKKLNFSLAIPFVLALFSCQSKPEKQAVVPENYTIQNYKLDDDEIARRKALDTIEKTEDTIAIK
ncbi:hypothetical protein [Flavobacterium eburneipallidum]|uniref:hypothetical protein n=1 Tax=Flavobacterium eburneipallidum TaxID=3003263 RepID=UPI0022AC6316|nr:hypothetical protein [Flavobacterium eburneipallidum]